MSYIPAAHVSLDQPTSLGMPVSEVVSAPLRERGIELTVVDAGARNGMFMLPDAYAATTRLVGFEPNKDEHRKLVERRTDAMLIGAHMPRFLSETFHPYALWDRREERPFYVTAGPGACTMMGHAIPAVTRRIYQDYRDDRAGRSFEELHSEVRETRLVQCERLDQLLQPETVVDFLKVDVEGGELRVLGGASDLFDRKNVLVVHTEFVALPYYEEHPVFGELHVFLHQHGLRLIDIEQGHATYSREPTRIPAVNDRRLLHAGDATFVLDPDRIRLEPEELQRMAFTALALDFNSFAVSLLRDAGMLRPAAIDAVEEALARVPGVRRFKSWWYDLPTSTANRLRGAIRRIRG